jgi:hypothetical protein
MAGVGLPSTSYHAAPSNDVDGGPSPVMMGTGNPRCQLQRQPVWEAPIPLVPLGDQREGLGITSEPTDYAWFD